MVKSNPKLKHHNLHGNSEIELGRGAQVGRRYIPSREKLRLWAKASKEGGRGRCEQCKEYFSMTYLRLLKNTSKPFSEPIWICVDCKIEHQEYKPI